MYLLVMPGPDKLLVPFTNFTKRMGDAAPRSLAIKGFAIACAAGLVLGTVLGVLQVALAVQMLLLAGQMIGLIPHLTDLTR